MEGVFYYTNSDGVFVVDMVKFVLPLVTAALIFVCWVASIALLAMVCACGDVYEVRTQEVTPHSMHSALEELF